RPWNKLVPDQSLVAGGQGEGEDHIQAARAADGSFVLAYTPIGQSFAVDLSTVPAGTVLARWYDPRNGDWLAIGEFRGREKRTFVPPSKGEQDDWVLVLEDAAKNYPID
ncbi:MAG TPA: putative collagen-binding domain-containing protein, partial [Spirochaetia bacterium]|nr:putative collagen-binding domain-containing protein [Spirochaetia bacterium]